ncbi:zinc finger, C2H2 type family protein, putative (macronuclear) [Tetrahymena thermophila SB210]|uniref:Zinc finger, C2H2 type family protein, putative n=1 Tax=Tetrahymena thermophila (strain SB210) TaxID=312017 RepID=Q23G92_TETTS|nr:zinc finger, C2H2 type family protein, putative [Tetrahymena thermophila SB210]EAR95368.2 zinc finger, C2H2 type family protein, putative [Tetrahymena thermophila SB210]|eukprot:XP_001015613.2 zinc finger, C2H2 type family protein, putative [Tetrahymena thermophila SB210]
MIQLIIQQIKNNSQNQYFICKLKKNIIQLANFLYLKSQQMGKKIIENQKKSLLILPKFECKCRREYDTLSSLTNHIKNEHNNLQQEFRIPRGVPGGRNKKIVKSERLYLEKVYSKDINQSQQLSDDEIRLIFKYINDLIQNIVQTYNVHNFQTELQRENIRLQPIWIKIKKENILQMMQQYLLGFLMFSCKQNLNLPFKYLNNDVFKSLKDCLVDEDNNQNKNSIEIFNQNENSLKMEEIQTDSSNQQIDEFKDQFIKKHLENNLAFKEIAL